MAITYTWTFPQLNVQTSAYGKTNVVYSVNWVCTGDDGEGHTAQAYGTCTVPYVAEDPFIAYPDLTQSEVLSWTTANLGAEQVTNIETYLSTQIADQINPPTATLPPPWN